MLAIQVVGSALLSPPIGGSLDCFDRVEKAVVQLRHLVTSTAPYGAGEGIPKALKPCSPMANDMDLTAYEAELFGNFQGTVQYNGEGSAPTVSDLCSIMTNTTASPLQAFASVADLFRPAGDGEGCVSSSFQASRGLPRSTTCLLPSLPRLASPAMPSPLSPLVAGLIRCRCRKTLSPPCP